MKRAWPGKAAGAVLGCFLIGLSPGSAAEPPVPPGTPVTPALPSASADGTNRRGFSPAEIQPAPAGTAGGSSVLPSAFHPEETLPPPSPACPRLPAAPVPVPAPGPFDGQDFVGSEGGPAPCYQATDEDGVFFVDAKPNLGLYFIRPYWSRRDFAISVPSGNGVGGRILADTRDVTNDYTVSPVFDANIKFGNLGFTFSGFGYALASSLDQAVAAGGANATLTATSSLSVTEAVLAAPTLELPIPEYLSCLKGCFQGDKVSFGFGPYYTKVTQSYSATLTGAGNTATLNSTQAFEGLGLVCSLELTGAGHDIYWPSENPKWHYNGYALLRGAAVLGENDRKSDFSVTGSAITSVHDNKTDLIPVGAFELGVECTRKNVITFRRGWAGNFDAGFRVAVMGQVIGDVGLPSAQSADPRAFENGALYLVGVGAVFFVSTGGGG